MPGDPFYTSAEWREFRRKFIADNPNCSIAGCPKPTKHVDHRKTIRSGGAKFDPANCHGMCWSHHSQKTARQDRPAYAQSLKEITAAGCDAQGVPLAPGHPWNTGKRG